MPASSPAPDPTAPADAPATSPGLTLSDLGSRWAIEFKVNRDNAKTSVTFAVPSGMTPSSMKAVVELPVNLRSGTLWISQGEKTVGRIALPDRDQGEVTIPLSGVKVFGNWASLDLKLTAIPLDNYCWDPDAPIRLVNPAMGFSGSEQPPTSVATFLPPVLRKVIIGVPAKPTLAESTAALQVASAVATRPGQNPQVVVVPLPDGATSLPGSAGQMERQIIVKEGPRKGLFLQGGPMPSLLISGPADEIAGQAMLLDSDAAKYAASPGAVAEELPTAKLVADNTSLKQLLDFVPTTEELWPDARIELDQTRWGHPIAGMSLNLLGSYTPLPPTLGGEVVISVGDEVLDRWPVDGDGVINRKIVIPDRLLKRTTVVDVGIRDTGDPGHCGDHLPISLRIDGDTKVTVVQANPPVPQGFQGFPQALMPKLRFGIGADALGDTARAAQIMVGLRRASAEPLVADVTTLQQAIDSPESAVLVSAGEWSDSRVTLPFTVEGGKLTVNGLDTSGQSASLTLDPEVKFGSLQTVFDGKRSLLVATSNGAPAQLDELLRYLSAESGRWSSLTGRAILSAPGREPITVPSPPADFSEEADDTGGGNWFWWAAGGIAVLAAMGAVTILVRARRS